jgi:hypothetical protein
MAQPDAEPFIAKLVATLAAHKYGPETTLQFLTELGNSSESQDMFAVVQEQVQEAQLAADVEMLAAAVAAYRVRTGAPPATLEALVAEGMLGAVPREPFGGSYVIDPVSGAVTSSTGRKPSRLHQSKIREKALAGESLRDI